MDLNLLFFNQVGRLRSGWRFCVFAVFFVVLLMMLATMASAAAQLFTQPDGATNGGLGFILSHLIMLAAAVCVGWLCAKWLEGLPFASLGWSPRKFWWRDLAFGIFAGAASLLLAAGIAVIGGLRFSFNPASVEAIAQTVVLSAAVFALGAASEETLFRGYPLQTFTRARLAWVAALLTSIPFALAHAGNQNVTAFGLINTLLAGVWLIAAYLKTRNLWFPFGVHWAWNWTTAAILGLPVSGITQITPEPILRGVDGGQAWLTGGSYGLEGGAACTIALIISTAAIWFAPFLKPDAEMLALTSRENPVNSEIG